MGIPRVVIGVGNDIMKLLCVSLPLIRHLCSISHVDIKLLFAQLSRIILFSSACYL